MKKVLFLFLLLPTINFSQHFKKEFSQDICNCFSNSTEKDINTLQRCFQSNIGNYTEEIGKLIDEDSKVSDYEQGKKLGEELFFEMQKDLIQGCNSYFSYFNVLREEGLIGMKSKYPISRLKGLKAEIEKNRNPEILWEIGSTYFLNEEYGLAENIYKESIALSPNYLPSILFLGWVNEKQKDYLEAIKFYNMALDISGKKEMILLIEIAKRKSNSKKLN